MKKILYYGIIISLVTFIGISSYKFFDFSSIENQQVKITTKENIINNNSTLAIQIQNDNDNGWHEADNRNAWPDKSIYTYSGAECSDMEGNELANYHDVLTFDTDTFTATINTKNTVYCTLYFSKGKPALNVLKENATGTGTTTFNFSSIVAEMYRYKGTNDQVTNNYICFGTNNPDTCKSTPGTYMFRIIGIQASENTTLGIPANSLKIIKAIKYGNTYQWNSSSGTTWDDANVNKVTLPAYYNTIKANNGVNWQNLILDNHNWYIGVNTNAGDTTENTTRISTTNNPIGLMYKSDFVNAYKDGVITNWLFIQNGWKGNNAEDEWTMSLYGTNLVWAVGPTAYNSWTGDSRSVAVRPTFYLVSDILLTGKGTTTDPFIITNKA